MEFLGGELLYAMRVVSHGAFNLCPSEAAIRKAAATAHCDVPPPAPVSRWSFIPIPEVPAEAVETGSRWWPAEVSTWAASNIWRPDGRRIFYDVNANSNLRKPIREAFGFDPFDRVAEWLPSQLG